MIISILFVVYIIALIIVCLLSFTKRGRKLQYDFFSWRDTKRFYAKRGIKWPNM